MSTFIYYSFVIVGTIMAIRLGWSAVKWAFQVWYKVFSLLIVGFILLYILGPLAFNLLWEFLLY